MADARLGALIGAVIALFFVPLPTPSLKFMKVFSSLHIADKKRVKINCNSI